MVTYIVQMFVKVHLLKAYQKNVSDFQRFHWDDPLEAEAELTTSAITAGTDTDVFLYLLPSICSESLSRSYVTTGSIA